MELLTEDAANKEATETRVHIGKVEVITSKMLWLQRYIISV